MNNEYLGLDSLLAEALFLVFAEGRKGWKMALLSMRGLATKPSRDACST